MILLCTVRPHRRSTLFPYTTLFRSDACAGQAFLSEMHDRRGEFPVALGMRRLVHGQVDRTARQVSGEQCPDRLVGADGKDRKSTRLNSSHVENSYAVFCLIKKKRYD